MQPNVGNPKILKFADDTKLFSAISEQTDLNQLQTEFTNLELWFKKWKMAVNAKKCGILKFSKSKGFKENFEYFMLENKLNEKSNEKDLGVIITTDMCYKTHIQNMVNKALKYYGWQVRTIDSRDSRLIIRLYKTLICSILQYGSPIWSPHKKHLGDLIEKVQKMSQNLHFIGRQNIPTLTG